jgi:hypothetical protein
MLVECDFERAMVQVTRKVEEMDLKLEPRRRCLDGGAMAKVQHGWVIDPVQACRGGIDTSGRQCEPGDVEVGGGESELTPALISADDTARDGVRSAEEAMDGGQVAALDGVANAGAADGLMALRDGGHTMNDEVELVAEALEQIEISRALMTEGKGGANAEAMDLAEAVNQLANERFSGDSAKGDVEGDQPGGVESRVLQPAESLVKRLDQSRGAVGGYDGVGMPVEGDGNRQSIACFCIAQGLTEHGLMAEVQAIEDPDGGTDRLGAGLQLVGEADDFHAGRRVRCGASNGKEKVRVGGCLVFPLRWCYLSLMLGRLWVHGARRGNGRFSSCFNTT